jgi:hypothetical protein
LGTISFDASTGPSIKDVHVVVSNKYIAKHTKLMNEFMARECPNHWPLPTLSHPQKINFCQIIFPIFAAGTQSRVKMLCTIKSEQIKTRQFY